MYKRWRAAAAAETAASQPKNNTPEIFGDIIMVNRSPQRITIQVNTYSMLIIGGKKCPNKISMSKALFSKERWAFLRNRPTNPEVNMFRHLQNEKDNIISWCSMMGMYGAFISAGKDGDHSGHQGGERSDHMTGKNITDFRWW